ncbi:hypothetical protein LZG07_11315 [Microbacterium profundi]|uniref:hypothetical protein n=1 Tax=Microbacterium profundi TaxID=450380 RepID=UPI001F2E3CE7|nr:hypothetical protein [Microbacterium profundi]MCE7482506.1 hypothetical protein [Microbacterium profundi]
MAARPRTAAVYRRRRLAIFGGLILLILAIAAGVWLAIAQPWTDAGGAPAPTSTSTPSSTPTVTDTPSTDTPSPEPTAEEPATAVPCQARDVTVEAVTDAETYPSGVLPQLSISLTNKGDSDCTIDVGSTTQVFTVSSGSDTWWRSTDCQQDPSSMVVTLAAGQTVTSATPVQWDRTRSDVATCDQENRPRAPGGGASYHVAVSIGGFEAVATRQILLY